MNFSNQECNKQNEVYFYTGDDVSISNIFLKGKSGVFLMNSVHGIEFRQQWKDIINGFFSGCVAIILMINMNLNWFGWILVVSLCFYAIGLIFFTRNIYIHTDSGIVLFDENLIFNKNKIIAAFREAKLLIANDSQPDIST